MPAESYQKTGQQQRGNANQVFAGRLLLGSGVELMVGLSKKPGVNLFGVGEYAMLLATGKPMNGETALLFPPNDRAYVTAQVSGNFLPGVGRELCGCRLPYATLDLRWHEE